MIRGIDSDTRFIHAPNRDFYKSESANMCPALKSVTETVLVIAAQSKPRLFASPYCPAPLDQTPRASQGHCLQSPNKNPRHQPAENAKWFHFDGLKRHV